MKKLFNIPTEEQLVQVANVLNTEFSDIKKDNMSIVFELDDDLLKQLDEDYFIKRNKDTNEEFIPSSEVNVICDGINFKFTRKADVGPLQTKAIKT